MGKGERMSKVLDELTKFLEEFDESPQGYGTQLRLDFAEIIWSSLVRKKWSQRRLSEQSGLADSVISNLVHGNKNCTLDTIGRILHALGTRATLREVAREDEWTSAPYLHFRPTDETRFIFPNVDVSTTTPFALDDNAWPGTPDVNETLVDTGVRLRGQWGSVPEIDPLQCFPVMVGTATGYE